MNSKTIKVVAREIIIILTILSVPYLFERIGYVDINMPFKKIDYRVVPQYSAASKDPSTIIFENNLIFLFKRVPAKEEIVNAYRGKGGPLVSKILCPMDSYESFWIFRLNRTFGFFGIEFDKLGRWLLFLLYPFYWLVRGIIWLIKAFSEIL